VDGEFGEHRRPRDEAAVADAGQQRDAALDRFHTGGAGGGEQLAR
jgi:hypothetical protein